MAELKYVAGLYFNKKHEKAPSFVLGTISIKPKEFMEWLRQNPADDKGYVRLKVNESRDGKPYVALDDWKPTAKKEVEEIQYPPEEIPISEIPF